MACQAHGEGILPSFVPIPIEVFGVTMHQPSQEELRVVKVELLQLFCILGPSGREKQFLQRHLGLISVGSSQDLDLPERHQTQCVRKAPTKAAATTLGRQN